MLYRSVLLTVLVCVLCVHPTQAMDVESHGSIQVSGQGVLPDGDDKRFKEDSLGEQGGVSLDSLKYLRISDGISLSLDSRYTTGGSGWLDFLAEGNQWRMGLKTTRVNRYSDTSFAPDSLPSGTSVDQLMPGTTALDPVLGEDSPELAYLNGEAFFTLFLSQGSSLTLTVGGSDKDGERVPNYGGFSFSDVGSPAFYTAGLEEIDASSYWANIEGRFKLEHLTTTIAAGYESREGERINRSPAYGPTGNLLDLNYWRDDSDEEVYWLRLEGLYTRDSFDVRGAFAYSNSSADVKGRDMRIDASGGLVQDGFNLKSGSIDNDVCAGAVGFTWRMSKKLMFTFSGDWRDLTGDGDGDLYLDGTQVPSTFMDNDEYEYGLMAQLVYSPGALWLRGKARFEHRSLDRQEQRDELLRDINHDFDTIILRADASYQVNAALGINGWLGYEDEDVDYDQDRLIDSYDLGDRSNSTFNGGLSLDYRLRSLRASLKAAFEHRDYDNDPPAFDPIFDPSQALESVSPEETNYRLAGNLLFTFSKGSVWAETGWQKTDFDLPVADSADTHGFAMLHETISGWTIAAGTEASLWEGGEISANIEWIQDSDDLDNQLLRGQVQVVQRILKQADLVGTWSIWDLNDDLYSNDEYTWNLFTLGLRVKF